MSDVLTQGVLTQNASAGPATVHLKPILKWAGGKRWLVQQLMDYWQIACAQSPRRLVEPFCGGLAVAMGLKPTAACLNDANPHLINVYRHVQAGLRVTEDFEHHRAYYNQARTRFNDLIRSEQAETPLAAQLFYYLNRTGFNGLCRFNQSGLFNVPFGRYKTIHYAADFLAYRALFAPWQFTCGDFEALTPQITPSDFIYADPPYDVPFVSYAQGGFDWTDQTRLAQWLAGLDVPVVVSNQATPRVLALYQDLGFRVTTLSAPRRIACNGNRLPAQEMLATLNLPK
ncbi:MAG: Dam family site-specific DNA-(adenine-N6)-methyltransferase [Vampirovibrionales bacterium]|nr:Dam family site-specific DNA-(adenine-N6)-methyltransferase [Vampirovibrionales bacterium]